MKNFRPLLFRELNVRLPGVRIRRLRLNRHLPERESLPCHAHRYGQILCYLTGRGSMTVGEQVYDVQPGAALFLPSQRTHSFRETTGRRPLCLVLDLDLRGATRYASTPVRLSQSELGGIKQELSGLMQLRAPLEPAHSLLVASAALRILDILLRSLGVLSPHQRGTPAIVRLFDRQLRQSDEILPPIKDLAARMGYQTDYLNRIFKNATGQTLREYRDAQVLERARQLLRERGRIREVCDELGFEDQNYFSRWFKKHTGQQPRAFAASPSA